MNEIVFKYRLAIGHFLCHAGVIIVCLLFLVLGTFDFTQVIPILSVVAPILAVYGPDVVKFVIQNKYKPRRRGQKLDNGFVTFSIIVFVVSHGLIYGTIFVYAFTGKMSPSQFQTAFGSIEVFFALYIGGVMRSLYQDIQQAPAMPTPKAKKAPLAAGVSTPPDEQAPEETTTR
jgi:hypothetical protein